MLTMKLGEQHADHEKGYLQMFIWDYVKTYKHEELPLANCSGIFFYSTGVRFKALIWLGGLGLI